MRPCSRCVSFGHECKDRMPSGPRSRGQYSRNVCTACVAAKVRCSEIRPCARCVRLGLDCRVPVTHTHSMLTPYRTGGYLPAPSGEHIFFHLQAVLESISPFALADLLSGTEMAFLSSLGGMCSVIPFSRRRQYLERILALAALQVSRPQMLGFVCNRIDTFLEPDLTSPLLPPDVSYSYSQLHALDKTRARMEYYLHKHNFESFPMPVGGRPAIMVCTYVQPQLVDGVYHVLMGTLNQEAEAITGYSCAEFQQLQNVITPNFSNFGGYPQLLRVYHRDDIHVCMAKGLLSYINPGVEMPFEARLIHKHGHVVSVRMATLATVKPDGALELMITVIFPIQSSSSQKIVEGTETPMGVNKSY